MPNSNELAQFWHTKYWSRVLSPWAKLESQQQHISERTDPLHRVRSLVPDPFGRWEVAVLKPIVYFH